MQDKRSDLVPDIPTTAEQGLPGLNAGVHFMMFAPAATPKPVVATLSAELRKVISDPAIKQRFADIGFDATPLTADEVAAAYAQDRSGPRAGDQAAEHQAGLSGQRPTPCPRATAARAN